MKRKTFPLFLALIFLVHGVSAAPRPDTADENQDGKIDRWFRYDKTGNLKNTAKDTNGDGRPDYFMEMVKGRNLVLRESDRNFDGKIDRRWMSEWDPNKRMITGMSRNNVPQYTAVPGYHTLWSEEDNDFDGKIDATGKAFSGKSA